MALGATVRDLLRLVLSRGLRLTIAGVAIGAAAALLLTRLMGNLLYKVSPRDPIAFGAALIILMPLRSLPVFSPPAAHPHRSSSRSAGLNSTAGWELSVHS
jgi:ABC-type antimicrobial peptide transport system permease subunit